ncbi:ARM repeat-containing protein [Wolfiporia cocos MD-104 SS10]|uniref:ARM repeat-containing protein n=1 Tax=Wolfiporia cocos (strain MD-104) TaxID=742152 RepID=A0A2H3J4E8_WOLCO|nr:ARM repeat-containing protein [Wolfiporia cocos MD-104 SS10]
MQGLLLSYITQAERDQLANSSTPSYYSGARPLEDLDSIKPAVGTFVKTPRADVRDGPGSIIKTSSMGDSPVICDQSGTAELSGAQLDMTATSNKRARSKRDVDRAIVSPSESAVPQSSAVYAEPLEMSESRWKPTSVGRKPQQVDTESPGIVDRKVRALLNKLTMKSFDSISGQIIAWANKSEKEKDARTLIQVIRLVLEQATNDATWSEIYARLCRKMMEQISSKIQDDSIKNAEGRPIVGGQLFRKYLLNRCQEDFERGWVAKETDAISAATKAIEDEAAKAAAKGTQNSDMYWDEPYAAQKARRRGLGLIKFIGELFKLQMLTERIMHECIKKLISNVDNPEYEEIESLCKLMTTVGKLLDTPKARAHVDIYFSRMKGLCRNPNVNYRMQFMLQDVIELRDRQWVPRKALAASTTIAAMHEAAVKEKSSESQAYQRTLNMSRGGSRRGDNRGDHAQVGPDGWAVTGNASPRAPPKAGDLSNFGKIQKTTSTTFGPTSVFAGKDKNESRESTLGHTGSINMFSKLMENTELASDAGNVKSSRPPSQEASVDFGAGGAPVPQRRKLQLLPRTLPRTQPKYEADSTPAQTEAAKDEQVSSVPSMTEEKAKQRVAEDSKEFFIIRDLDEAEAYFTRLPSEHKFRLVNKLVSQAIESKEADAQLVADFFSRAASKNLCSPQSFEEGFAPAAETLGGIAIYLSKATKLMETMRRGARLDSDEAQRI